MINYIIQIIFFQVIFLAVYDLFLRNETFFKWNRLYLLITPILSFIIPLLKFESIQKVAPQNYVLLLPEIVLNPQKIIEQTTNSVESLNYLNIVFYVGIVFVSILFLIKLTKIIRLTFSNNVLKKENYKLVLLESNQSAFSFFNYIFVGKSLYENEELQIIQHELVHSKQYHTLDLLFFEFLKIITWFNPMIYIYQKRITVLHEYISDAEVVKATDKNTYFNNLLAMTFDVENIKFVNQFYKQSLIKNRIIMIAKEKSQKMKQLKYLVLVPLLASMLFYTSCTNEEEKVFIDTPINLRNDEKLLEIINSSDKGTIETQEGVIKFFRKENGELIFLDEEQIISLTKVRKEIQRINNLRINTDTENYPIFKMDDIIVQEVDDYGDISFSMVDKVPQFPGCEGSDLKNCFNQKVRQHVAENFNINVAKNLGLTGKQKIYVKFIINKEGLIEIEGARAPHKDLEKEARRVVNSLPKMIPGAHNGKKVNVTYMLPITFEVK